MQKASYLHGDIGWCDCCCKAVWVAVCWNNMNIVTQVVVHSTGTSQVNHFSLRDLCHKLLTQHWIYSSFNRQSFWLSLLVIATTLSQVLDPTECAHSGIGWIKGSSCIPGWTESTQWQCVHVVGTWYVNQLAPTVGTVMHNDMIPSCAATVCNSHCV